MIFKAKAAQILCVFSIFLFTSTCQSHCIPRENNKNLLEAISGIENFGINLLNELVDSNPEKNAVVSPLCSHSALSMARLAAVGLTASNMDKALGFHNKTISEISASYFYILREYQDNTNVQIANKLFIKNGLEVQEELLKLLENRFFAPISTEKFAEPNAVQRINNWVEDKTNNLIKDLIPPGSFTEETRSVLVNAIHFKGEWLYPFSETDTFVTDFYLNNNDKFSVQMMVKEENFRYIYLPKLKAFAFEMPYKNSNLAMVVILPDSVTGLKELLNTLQATPLSDIRKQMKSFGNVTIYMPKFTVEFQTELREPLSKMGMERMFSPAAEFPNMLKSSEAFYVSNAIHKTFIEVSENGVKAAAATGLIFDVRESGDEIYVNKPFYFAITDKKDTKLFEGAINHKF